MTFIQKNDKMELTTEQKHVLYHIVKDVRGGKKQITMGGFAGAGKSFLITYLIKFFPDYAIAAYTGKATNVLRKKGLKNASTIHSRIYKPFFQDGMIYFDLNPDPDCSGFIIDESSMLSEDIYDDLKSYDMPIIAVGDHGQLEPIGSNFNLMKNPDYTLEEIHRNAGDIARFAETLRYGYAPRGFKCSDGTVDLVSRTTVDDYMDVDQVICAYNKTRVQINTEVRKALGHKGIVNEGERVMCLRNNKQLGLFNGMQGTVVGLHTGRRGRKCMDFEFDGTIMKDIWYDPKQFGQESHAKLLGKNTPNPFDYAYCVTAHKAQGDEWEKVLVIEQRCANWSHSRWSYTCASRAKTKLIWRMS